MDAVDGDTNRAKLALQKAKDDLTVRSCSVPVHTHMFDALSDLLFVCCILF